MLGFGCLWLPVCDDPPLQTSAYLQDVTTDSAVVAARLEGMIFRGFDGPVAMRAVDHQLQKGVYISRWQKVGGSGAEGTGYAFVPVQHLPAAALTSAPGCQMERP